MSPPVNSGLCLLQWSLLPIEVEDQIRGVFPVQVVRVHGPEVHAIIRQLVCNLMDMAIPTLAQFGAHIAVELQFLRGTLQRREEFRLISLGTVVRGLYRGTGIVLAVVHGYHLPFRSGQQVFLHGAPPADQPEFHGDLVRAQQMQD